ncbi:lamin tail domain-containing protein [Natronococcus roseus]|uniref:lamin tail domain-containing protein n=1 Tax=Natronococcus roseus TaxID=1052014 RepID=UPI00374D6A62
MTGHRSRRAVLAGAGAAVAGLVGIGSQAAADGHGVPVVIESVTPEQDLIVLRNEGESTVDLSGYVVDWLYNNPDYDQSDSLPSGTEIAPGGELRITSGYYDTDADVTYDYEAGRIDNEGTNVIALYTPSRSNAVSVYDTSTGETEPGDPVDDSEDEETEDEESEDEEAEDEEPEDGEAEPDEPEPEDGEREDEGEETEEKPDESEPEAEEEETAERKEDDCPEEEAEKEESEEDDCSEEEKKEPEPEDDDCPDEEAAERSEKGEKETDESERTQDDC